MRAPCKRNCWLNTGNGHYFDEKQWCHYTLATPNKLLDALVPRAELSTFLDITNTPLKVNAPIGLGIVLSTQMTMGDELDTKPCCVEDSTSCQ